MFDSLFRGIRSGSASAKALQNIRKIIGEYPSPIEEYIRDVAARDGGEAGAAELTIIGLNRLRTMSPNKKGRQLMALFASEYLESCASRQEYVPGFVKEIVADMLKDEDEDE